MWENVESTCWILTFDWLIDWLISICGYVVGKIPLDLGNMINFDF